MGSAREQRTSWGRRVRAALRRALRPRPSLAGAALVSGVLVLTLAPAAMADKSDRAFPTRDEVAAAERRVSDTANDVGAIKAGLLLANRRLEAAAVEAEMASETYNGAIWRLQVAREELASARGEAAVARRTVSEQRTAIGALVAASYQQGSQLTAFSAMVGADGPEGVLDQYATFQGASDSLQADYDRFAAADALAKAFEKRAEEVRAKAKRLAAEAREAKEEAARAADEAQAVAAEMASEKDRLIRKLARLQDISVSLARQRQVALEELARERAEARARAEAEEAARQQALEDARNRAEARKEARAREGEEQARAEAERQDREERQQQAASRSSHDDKNDPAPPPPASPQPAPAPPPPAQPPSGSGGAERAIAFAKAQLGDPYV
ncbi:MAG TPA: hypothetical protein VLA62_10665, partial [Solirubrobacterales bacterium]|nr:hypothetical protein [Solirubrobacterales bacterium]